MKKLNRGIFIVIEGCDRCGKTTQCQILLDKFVKDGLKVKSYKFPDRSTIVGSFIDKYLRKELILDDKAIHLLFAINRWEVEKELVCLLKDSTSLIVDRYSYSGVVYSASKKGMDEDFCKETEIGLPKPDLVLFLEGSIQDAADRLNYGEEIYENMEFQKIVKKNFQDFFGSSMEIINADGCIEEVNNRIVEAVNLFLSRNELSDISRITSIDMKKKDSDSFIEIHKKIKDLLLHLEELKNNVNKEEIQEEILKLLKIKI